MITSISTRNPSISLIFSTEIVPMNRNFWVCYFLLGVVGHGKPCPNLARSVRGVSGWYELFRQVKIVQNESLVNYTPALQQGCLNFVSQFCLQIHSLGFLNIEYNVRRVEALKSGNSWLSGKNNISGKISKIC